jgi:RNA polymerase sigma factor (sigma-70 family)
VGISPATPFRGANVSEIPDERPLLEHARFLHRLVRSIVLDESSADDVVQETWLAARAKPPREEIDAVGWFARVARRLALRMRRSARRRIAREEAVAQPERTRTTLEEVSRSEVVRIITKAVLELDEPYRSAVMMRYHDELGPEEIARRCQAPVATIQSRLQRAKARLRERLTAKLGPDLREALGWIGGIPAGAGTSTVVVTAGAAATSAGAKLVVCGGLVLAAGAAWWIGGGTGSPPVQPRGPVAPASAQAAAAPGDASSRSPTAAVHRAEDSSSKSAAAAGAESRGDGTIDLKIVDAAGGAALADTPFIVYSERPRVHVFKRAVTDANGMATIRDLPSDAVIFETGRRPPHANTVFATWLRAGEQKSVVMAVGHGGTARGRVVDDAGGPIAGVDVSFDPRPGGETLAKLAAVLGDDPDAAACFAKSSEPVTTTDGAGRFEIDSILARPAAIWIEHGAMSPRRFDAVIFDLRWRLLHDRASAKTDEGVTRELPDVVWERPRRYAGRVLGADGTPIGGALVSTRYERTYRLGARAFDAPFIDERPGLFGEIFEGAAFRFDLAPWEEGFAAALGEAVTAVDGSFEIESLGSSGSAFVAARDAGRKSFDLPTAAPGARVDGLEFRLPVVTQFDLEVTDADGAPLPATSQSGAPCRPEVFAITRDRAEICGDPKRAGPTTCGVSFELAPAAIAELVVRAPDYGAASHSFETPPVGRARIAFALARKRTLELPFHLHYADEGDRPSLAESTLRLCARIRPRSGAGSAGAMDGDGVFDTIDFTPKLGLSFKFRVPSRGPWFISLRGPFLADSPESTEVEFGSFEPDGTTHELEIPKANATWLAAQQVKRERDEDPEAAAATRPVQGTARFTFVDANTRETIPIERLHFEFVKVGEPPQLVPSLSWYSTSGGRGARTFPALGAAPGRYTFRVAAHGYRDSAPITLTIVADETIDGGTILLEPIPDHLVRLVQPDGRPVGAGWQLELFDPATFGQPMAFYGFDITTDAHGVAAIRREIPPRSLLMAWPPRASFGGPQLAVRHELSPWPIEETLDVKAPPMQRVSVVVDLAAIEAALRETSFSVCVRFADEPQPKHSIGGTAAESSVPLEGARRFWFSGPPGRYCVSVSSRLFTAPETTIEVVESASPPEFRLVAQPR